MISERLHTLTHRITGVPEHDDNRPAQNRSRVARGHQGRGNHPHQPHGHTAEPRVLVRWQRWIASLGPQGRTHE
ncbi:hypothetical protein [Leifsonia naganoensis]|uniref:Uncharacterized protein n=1 Tax=Leifsonia naganoensis TaxID=150025 RepID=A0A853DRU3_9MICO|nr:hypothetical protein [Leifsonia naganoensis]NYK11762.1 hypothetical protein [Leifsonia naganoensis]